MSMERLSFSPDSSYNAIELVIHISRYSTAQNLCRGLNVLDVACGEGYGAYAMASFWGAKSVTGVDISEEAITAAQNVFPHPNVKYIASTAESIDKLFAPDTFDLVVSLETIEHVRDPEEFLAAIKKVLKPGGIVVLSCPNDHWLYGPGETQNPFHLRTYYFEEFKEQAEKHLGEAKCFLLGRPINGFGNFLLDKDNGTVIDKNLTDEFKNMSVTPFNQIGANQALLPENSLYFVGVWGDLPVKEEKLVNGAFFPIPMNNFSITLDDRTEWLESVEKWNKELQTAFQGSQDRVIELEKWANELQVALKNSENRILELEKHNGEESQTSIVQLQKALADAQEEQKKMESALINSNTKIDSMEASKFWKLRTLLVKFKQSLQSSKKVN